MKEIIPNYKFKYIDIKPMVATKKELNRAKFKKPVKVNKLNILEDVR